MEVQAPSEFVILLGQCQSEASNYLARATSRKISRDVWVGFFSPMGNAAEKEANEWWKKVGDKYELVDSSNRRNSTGFPDGVWSKLGATRLMLEHVVNGLSPRDSAKVGEAWRDPEPTVAITPKEAAAARAALDKIKAEALTPAQKALLEAVRNATTVEDLIVAVQTAAINGVREYPSNSRPNINNVKGTLLELQAAEKKSFVEAQQVWITLSPKLPSYIQNNFEFKAMTPDGKPMLQRKVPRI